MGKLIRSDLLEGIRTPRITSLYSSFLARRHHKMARDSGFFPVDYWSLRDFYFLMKDAARNLDVLGSWLPDEDRFIGYENPIARTELSSLEPFFSEEPWTQALESKRVLVIHPFAESIKAQYLRRGGLFPQNSKILPEFELTVLRAPQTLGGTHEKYQSWFDALFDLWRDVLELDFDVAIVGAGAYGFPISSWISELDKPVIHLGGVTQLLFGIRGNRWDNSPEHRHLVNSDWVRPLPNERPVTEQRVAENSYW